MRRFEARERPGELTPVGTSRPATSSRGSLTTAPLGPLPFTRIERGLRLYRGLIGALKVRDRVEIALDVALSTG